MHRTTFIPAIACLMMAAASVQAGMYYDTVAAGDWATASNWGPTAGVPGVDDWIHVDQTMTVSSDQSFGDSTGTNNSTFGQYGLTINAGSTLTNVAGSTLEVNSNNNSWIGGGTFVNDGTYVQTFRGHIGSASDTLLFQNNGVIKQSAGNWLSFDAGSTLRLAAGSTYRTTGSGSYQLMGAGTITTVDAGSVLQAANFDVQSSSNLRVTNTGTGEIKFASLSVASGSYIEFASPNITYSSDDPNVFQVAGKIKITNTFRVGSDFVFNAAEGVDWTAGVLYTNGHTVTIAAGNTVTSNSTIYGDGTSGTLVNNGTYQINFRPSLRDNATLENNALIDIVVGAGYMNYDGSLVNNAGGSIVKGATSGTNTFTFNKNTINPIFINNGLVEVDSGAIYLHANVDTTQFFDIASKALTNGSWKVNDTGSGATLTIGDASTPKITTIGANASVVLENAGATFNYLEASLTTVDGTLLVNGTKNLAPTNALTVNGVLGGTGTITAPSVTIAGTMAPGNSPGTLAIDGDLAMLGGSAWAIEIADPAGAAGTDWDLVTVTGELGLPTSGVVTLDIAKLGMFADSDFTILIASAGSVADFDSGDFAFSYDTNDFAGVFSALQQGNDVVLSYSNVVPEPASILLVGAGGVMMLLRRRGARA